MPIKVTKFKSLIDKFHTEVNSIAIESSPTTFVQNHFSISLMVSLCSKLISSHALFKHIRPLLLSVLTREAHCLVDEELAAH